jgi:uncharacterized coiled-coil protein SlyX
MTESGVETRLDHVENSLDHVETRLSHVEIKLDKIEITLLKLSGELTEIKIRGEAYDVKLDAYQRASVQIVNLAFGLIITAVLAIIIPAVVGG